LDVADLVLDKELNLKRWFSGPEVYLDQFISICAQLNINLDKVDVGLPALVHDDARAIVLSHPLWHTREGLLGEFQSCVADRLAERFSQLRQIDFVDVREFRAAPQKFIMTFAQV
jgi:DEAD/DEAH box helicase domain-containing protein